MEILGDIGRREEEGWPAGPGAGDEQPEGQPAAAHRAPVDRSVVTWRRAQMVLFSAQGMDVAQISRVTFTSPDRVRDVLHTCNLDGFDALYPRHAGGRPPTCTLAQRGQIKQFALSRPQDHDLSFST